MISASMMDDLTFNITRMYEDYADSIVKDIARRIGKLDFAKPTAALQAQRLNDSGLLYETILQRVGALTGKSEAELKRMFHEAGFNATKFDDEIYRKAGLNPLPLNLSHAMQEVLVKGLAKTGGVMRNLTMTTAISGQEAYMKATDLAYMQISSGAMGYAQAVKAAVKNMADEGIKVVTFPGRTDQIDVAIRRAAITGVSQTSGKMQLDRAEEMGQDLIQVSAHIGARPDHMEWQGKVYSRKGSSKKHPNFEKATGYGTGSGLMGWNCRHSFYPFFEGISEELYSQKELDEYADKKVLYNGKEMSFYDATQEQRGIERKIRKYKRQAESLEAAGLDNGQEFGKLRDAQAEMRKFIKQTGLVRQRNREGSMVKRFIGEGWKPPVAPKPKLPLVPKSALIKPPEPPEPILDLVEPIIQKSKVNAADVPADIRRFIRPSVRGKGFTEIGLPGDISASKAESGLSSRFIRELEQVAEEKAPNLEGIWVKSPDETEKEILLKVLKMTREEDLNEAERQIIRALEKGGKEGRFLFISRDKAERINGVLGWYQDPASKRLVLEHLGVLTEGQGTGSDLMRQFIEEAMDNGLGIQADNIPPGALRFFSDKWGVQAKNGAFALGSHDTNGLFSRMYGDRAYIAWLDAHPGAPQLMREKIMQNIAKGWDQKPMADVIASKKSSGNEKWDKLFPDDPDFIIAKDGTIIEPTNEELDGQGIFTSMRVHIRGNGDAVLKTDTGPKFFSITDGFAKREVVASRIDKLVGLDVVPETTEFIPKNRHDFFSLQRFAGAVDDPAHMGCEVNISKSLHALPDQEESARMVLLDLLSGNTDRHGGNWMINSKHIFAIDNGLTFVDMETDIQRLLDGTRFNLSKITNPATGKIKLDISWRHKLIELRDNGKFEKTLGLIQTGNNVDTRYIRAAMDRLDNLIAEWDTWFY